jgi:ferrochelatase
MSKTGVLLMAHGSPESLDEMEKYLNLIMTRTRPTPEFVEEMKERYATFGGRSPLLDITLAQVKALQAELDMPVYAGMRHWTPFIKDVAPEMEKQGIDRIVGIVMAPHNSTVSVGAYHKAAQEAVTGADLVLVDHWHDEPLVLDAWAEKIKKAGTSEPILFTAHSVPVRAAEPYRTQVRETIQGIVERVGDVEWDLAWQSKPNAPGEWLEPEVDDVLESRNWKSVLVAPIGFVTDHAEVLYDIDHLHRATAERLGMKYRRTEMLNDSPLLIKSLAKTVREAL